MRLDIFDLDDTLTKTPTFSEVINSDDAGIVDLGLSGDGDTNKSHLRKVSYLFQEICSKNVCFKVQRDFITIIDKCSNSSMSKDSFYACRNQVENELSKPDSDFSSKFKKSDLRLFLKSISLSFDKVIIKEIKGFYRNDKTIGHSVNEEVYSIYQLSTNKMIVTGRHISLKPAIDVNFKWSGIEFPNKGFYCFPGTSGLNIPEWKSMVICQEIERGNYTEVHFYEDKLDWLKIVGDAVNLKFNNVNFIPHHVTNISDSKSF